MKRKVIFLLILSAIITNSFAETVTSDADEVVIDLNENTLTSDSGVKVTNGTMSGVFYKLRRDPATGEMFFTDNALINIDQPTGNIKIETERGNVSQKDEKGEFYNSFAYMNVGKTTGAEAPNDRIFFGSPYIKYENENVYVKNGWLTTDFNIVNFPKEPNKAGYHLLSSDMLVEPDKQITLKKINLFINGKDITPFDFPWFRANIRRDSKVPLFATIQSSDDYGSTSSMGVLYGNRGDKFRGGIAPKFADKMGWLIGRWENWYKTDTMGETRLNIDDLLLYSKERNEPKDSRDLPSYEKRHRRYKLELSHSYSGENGTFDFIGQNSTRSMVSSLVDVMDKYDDNNVYRTLGLERYKFDKNIGFYNLNANLFNLGENKDLSFTGKMQLVSDKKAYGLLVYDDVDDISFGSSIDHDLYTNLALKKDNDKYRLTASYDYLYDLDPGSTASDLMSRNERIKAEYLYKENGAGISVDKRTGDDFRRFSLWEEDINTTARHKNVLGIDMNYTPTTISKYEFNNFQNIKVSLGDYKVGTYTLTPSASYNYVNRKLDTTRDTYRSIVLGNERVAEYNRFENIIYEDALERRADLTLKNDNEIYRVGAGKTDSEIWTREGLFDGTYNSYVNKSRFYELELGRENIELGNFGKLGLNGTFRQDDYDTSSDKTNSVNLKLNNDLYLYKSQDLNVTNKFRAEWQKFSFFGDKDNDERRLYTKKDYIKLDNSIEFDTLNTKTIYDIGYKRDKNPYGLKNKSGEIFNTGLKFKFADDSKLSLNYKEDKRFTDKTRDERNYNDLGDRTYSINYENKKHEIGFSNTDIKFKAEDFNTVANFKEKINEHRVKYGYKFDNSKLTVSYAQGTDKLDTINNQYLDRKNREYTMLYNIYGDVEKDFYASYKTYRYGNSRSEDEIRNTDVYRFSFDYRDKRFEEQELMKYATLEYEKPKDEITSEDIANIRSVLDRTQQYNRDFMFTKISDESFRLGNYKKTFKGYVKIEKNNLRYSQTGNLKNSLSKFEGGVTYSYNRVGVGYKFTEKASWKRRSGSYNWSKDTREHELSAFAKIGKPSEGWRIKTYAMFYDNFNDQDKSRNRKRALDSIGIEIGREMGFYEWAVSYENRYKTSSRDYEWRAGVHFTLLTFPSNSIFGVGARNAGGNASTRPEGYLLDRPSQLKNSY